MAAYDSSIEAKKIVTKNCYSWSKGIFTDMSIYMHIKDRRWNLILKTTKKFEHFVWHSLNLSMELLPEVV